MDGLIIVTHVTHKSRIFKTFAEN